VLEDAAVWTRYVDDSCSLAPIFHDDRSVRRALTTAASYEPDQLQAGEIAFTALVALKDERFVSEVRLLAQDPQWRAATAERLLVDPDYALDIPGAEATAMRATQILIEQGRRVYESGKAVRQASYSVQKRGWARGKTPELAMVRKLSASHYTAKPIEEARLFRTLLVLVPDDGPELQKEVALQSPHVSPTVARGLALAALAVLGRARDGNGKAAQALLTDRDADACLRLAKLDLYQCLAVSNPRYEDLYCAGEHGLKETGRCLAGAAVNGPGAFKPAETARLDKADVLYVRKDYFPPR
jgi:hypothetical protein